MELFEPTINLLWEGHWESGKIEHRRRIYDCELVYLSEGRYNLILDDEEIAMNPGMAAIIPPAYWHESCVSDSRVVFRHCVHFDWLPNRLHQAPLEAFYIEPFDHTLANRPPPWLSGYLPAVFSPVQTKPIQWLLKDLFKQSKKADKTKELLLWPVLRYFNSVILDCAEENWDHSIKTHLASFALKRFIDTNYDDQIGYVDFEKLTKLSKSYLCTLFRNFFGYPPFDYLKQVRLIHAREVLVTNIEMNISQVAFRVGFQSSNYFTRVFRNKFDMSPTEYRNMMLKAPESHAHKKSIPGKPIRAAFNSTVY